MRWGTPNRVNYNTRFPLPEGSRDCFSQNVVRAIHVGIDDLPPISGAEQPARDTLAGVVLVVLDWLAIQEAALASVALIREHDLDAYQLGFIGQHLNKAGVWHLDKVLVVPLPNADLLLPAVAQLTNAFFDKYLKGADAKIEALPDEQVTVKAASTK